ncbi:MAG: hypothetical protein SGBAC_010735 [Bacillariaceae sp.]
MFDPSKPMAWFYFVSIALFCVYVFFSLFYMARRSCALRQPHQQFGESSATAIGQQIDPDLDNLEEMIERQREDGKAKRRRLRSAMHAFVYEIYSEDTRIATVPFMSECNKGNSGEFETDGSNGNTANSTTLVLGTEKKKEKSARGLKKCCSTGNCSSTQAESEVNGSTATSDTEGTAIIPDEDESTTALSRRLDKELGAEPKCVICLEPYKYSQVICSARNEACGHIFHGDCIQQWVQQNSECPLCRVTLINDDDPEENV